MIGECEESHEHPNHMAIPLYFRATIDPEAHLTLKGQINSLPVVALVDSGLQGYWSVYAPKFCSGIQGQDNANGKIIPQEVPVIDGPMINSGLITREATIEVEVGDHWELLVADITNMGPYPCILRTPWLVRHDPTIRWSEKEVMFESVYCQEACLSRLSETEEKSRRAYPRKPSKMPSQIVLIAMKHVMVLTATFRLYAKGAEVYALEVSKLTKETMDEHIPVVFKDVHGAFSKEASNELLDHGVSDMKIEFKERKEPCNTGLWSMSPKKLEELQHYLEENLEKGWIRQSKSPVSDPIMFARKKDGSIRVCMSVWSVDFYNLNQVTIKN